MSVSLKVEKRATRPRSLRNELRHAGKIPAIVYGYQVENTPVAIDEREIAKIIRENGANTVLSFDLNGKAVNALLGAIQANTFSKKWEHVELIAVNMNEVVEVEAELQIQGEEAIVKAGGELAQALYSVKVSATPDKLPEFIPVNIAELKIGDSLTVADLPASADYTYVTPAEEHILSIFEKQEAPEEEETAEPAEAPAE